MPVMPPAKSNQQRSLVDSNNSLSRRLAAHRSALRHVIRHYVPQHETASYAHVTHIIINILQTSQDA